MYVLFFALLSGLGYGSLFFRHQPILLLVGIMSFSILMLAMTDSGTNTEGEVVIGMNFDTNWAGTEQGTSTDIDRTGSDEIVLLKLQGWEYTVWVWMHLFLIVVNGLFFFHWMMTEVM
tara:strand:+ start:37 stop:390 length:354 start_codon:yes stop_codon:yes gene_type:complete